MATFGIRQRFNWGYHDAASVHRRGLGADRNFGFGPKLTIRVPEDVLRQHYDAAYAEGWVRGYADAEAGRYEGNSGHAWDECATENAV